MRDVLALVLVLCPLVVWADGCTQYTIMQQGKMLMCTQCCYGGHCQVTCL